MVAQEEVVAAASPQVVATADQRKSVEVNKLFSHALCENHIIHYTTDNQRTNRRGHTIAAAVLLRSLTLHSFLCFFIPPLPACLLAYFSFFLSLIFASSRRAVLFRDVHRGADWCAGRQAGRQRQRRALYDARAAC